MSRVLMAGMLALGTVAACGRSEPAFLARTVVVDGVAARYQVYTPAGYTPSRPWPVILFLHGAGERGRDGAQQTGVGLGPALRQHPERFPSVVVFPQAGEEETWHGPAGGRALAALHATMRELNGDPTRIYLVGLSMGAFGAWELAFEEPDRFAAIVTVSGGLAAPPPWDILNVPLDAEDPYAVVAGRLRGIPVWLFHGADDDAIPPAESRQLRAAFERLSSPVRHTEYAGVGHRAWERAFGEPGLWSWLFEQRRPGARWLHRSPRRSAAPISITVTAGPRPRSHAAVPHG